MPKQIKRDPVEQLEGTGGGGSLPSFKFDRLTGSRGARDTKEPADKQSELSGKMRFRESKFDDEVQGRTPKMSDDYAKGGKVGSASKRADGCAERGKTKGRMI
jgi:hypothetical protein